MDGKVTPKRMPNPRTVLGYDGTDFHALKVDSKRRLSVRGEDQLHSHHDVVASSRTAVISGADGYVDSNPAAADQVWHITSTHASDGTSAITGIHCEYRRGATAVPLDSLLFAAGAGYRWFSDREFWLKDGAYVRVWFSGGLVGDSCTVALLGESMTKET